MRRFRTLNFVILIYTTIFLTPFAMGSDILLFQDVPLKSIAKLTPENIRSDLEILLFTLDSAYGGKNILPDHQYEKLVAGLRSLKQTQEILTSEDLCNRIADLTEQVNDYHLTVHIESQTCRRTWPLPTVGVNSGYGSNNQTWSLSTKPVSNKTAPVLAIQKMSASGSPDWDGFIETVQILVKESKPFIIDMRRNPGGDLTKGLEMSRILYGLGNSQSLPSPQKQIYRRRTPSAWALLANVSWLQLQNLNSMGQAAPDYIKNNYLSLVNYQKKAVDRLIPPLEIENLGEDKADLSHAISFPVYVLIDKNCGSSCELTLEALESLPAIQTVGESTTGVVQYGNVGELYLPNSHILIRIPTQGAHYDDNRQIEKIGYSPKWQVQSGTDALDFTLSHFFLQK